MITKLIYCKRCTFPTRQVMYNEDTHEYKCVCGEINKDTSINEEDKQTSDDDKNDKEKGE